MSWAKKVAKKAKKAVGKAIKVTDKQFHDITGKHIVKMPKAQNYYSLVEEPGEIQALRVAKTRRMFGGLLGSIDAERLDKENATLG